ncbi:MAG: hypothetical protein GXP38_05355 [Chloroflexi bacterium]|nr:hypothetical protein [Chloroflexota bacterium]
MFRSKSTKWAMILVVTFLLGISAAWVIQASISNASSRPIAGSLPSDQNDENSRLANITTPDSRVWVFCTTNSIGVFENRIHVLCNESFSGIRYFAYPTANAAVVARFLSVLTSAQVSGRTLRILYDPADHNGSAYNCAVSDCRPLQAVALY